jgi:signal transduction histidine kinase
MAAGIAHDLNNWLSVVLTCTTLALDQLDANESARIDVREAHEAAQHAAALTRRLLALGHGQRGRRTAIDVNDALTSVEKLLRRLLSEGIQFFLSTKAEGHVVLDPMQFDQIVLNLAVNARDAMKKGGRLTIETSDVTVSTHDAASAGAPAGTYVRLSVTDTGCGLDATTRAHIFEPFFTTKGADEGTGLGLSTVSEIVAQCGGHIAVHSEVGQGARFDVYFPAVEGPAESSCTRLRGTMNAMAPPAGPTGKPPSARPRRARRGLPSPNR